MNEDYTKYPDNAKVWIYQSSKVLDKDEVDYLRVQIDHFLSTWESHGKMLTGTFEIFDNLFVVLFVDEQGDTMCGRAQDASVKLMKQLEQEIEVEFVNRMIQAYKKDDKVEVVHMNDFATLLADNEINENTIVFNNTITTKAEFDSKWKVPLKDSWHKQLLVVNS